MGSTRVVRTSITFIAAGDVASISNVVDTLALRLANSLNVARSAISIRVVSASVRIIVEITTPPGATATAVEGSLATIATQGAAQATTLLGITVESVTQPTTTVVVIPAPPPPPSPPSPPPPQAEEPAPSDDSLIIIVAAGSGGGVVLFAVILFFCRINVKLWRKANTREPSAAANQYIASRSRAAETPAIQMSQQPLTRAQVAAMSDEERLEAAMKASKGLTRAQVAAMSDEERLAAAMRASMSGKATTTTSL